MLSCEKPVVFFGNGIGDHLLNLPAIRALASLFQGRMTLVCMPGSKDVFFSDVRVSACVEVVMPRAGACREFEARDLAVRIGKCDAFISLNPWHSESVDMLLERLAPRWSIGFFSQFHVSLARDYFKHSADLAFDVPRFLNQGLTLETFAAPPRLLEKYVCWADELREMLPPSIRILAVHADSTSDKMWPRPRLLRMLGAFLERNPTFVVWVIGKKNLRLDVGRFSERVMPFYNIPLAMSFCLVRQSDIFLGVDSCMLHAADLFRVPGVGLFGPTNPSEWGFRFSRHRHLRSIGSLTDLHEDKVMESIESLLAETTLRKDAKEIERA